MRRGWVAALGCLVLATGCRFAVVGDSVVSITRDELNQRGALTLANGGVDIPTAREALHELGRGEEPLVISLGLMDTSRWATAEQIERRIRNVLEDDVVDVDCVIWVDLHESSNVHRDWPERAAAFNDILEEVAGGYDRPVARWSERSADHPGWFQADGVHPNRLGQRHYAAFLAASVGKHC
jgi:hypothetical protein